MKAITRVLFAFLMAACTVTLFAQPATEYVVQSVTGKVEVETTPGNWDAVTVGMKLAPSAVVNTGLNSSLVLKAADRALKIKAMQKGTIDKLVAAQGTPKSGVKVGAKAKASSANSDDVQGRTNISTASTRASDATKDIEWTEE
ncbi:MAG TPA: hypothetical protein PKO22_06450 [Treponemataceae bacterium]|nr:hypothetical protein [Treponemataceae bacterium]